MPRGWRDSHGNGKLREDMNVQQRMSERLKSWQLVFPSSRGHRVGRGHHTPERSHFGRSTSDNRSHRQRNHTVTSSPRQRCQVRRACGERTASFILVKRWRWRWRKVEHGGFGVRGRHGIFSQRSWHGGRGGQRCCQCRVPGHSRLRWLRVTPTLGHALMGRRPISPICTGMGDEFRRGVFVDRCWVALFRFLISVSVKKKEVKCR